MYRINYFSMQQISLKVGDMVMIRRGWFKAFKHHCMNSNDIPLHNHGKVICIELNHPLKDIECFRLQTLITIEFDDKTTTDIYSNDIIKLY